MCGIVGFIDKTSFGDINILRRMRDTLHHRGPDDRGEFITKTNDFLIAFGHVRLSILDLSSAGHQPMCFENLTITYNGEVYNFKEIRKELEKYGYVFSSNSDTEVILKSFHKWGIRAVDKFRGMFAFAIYDSKSQKIFIFRDRTGVKPLFYYKKGKTFMFASELKAFHKHPKFEKVKNQKAIPFYFRFGYIPAPMTIFENTYKLKPGHYLEIDLNTFEYKELPYWRAEDKFLEEKLNKNEKEIIDELEDILKDSFKLRMVADVPVGVFLSGGIDSTLVTALLQSEMNQPLNTFTIGFKDEKYDEAKYAKDIAKYLGTNHTEYYCDEKDMLDFVEDLQFFYDEPFGDSSALPTILVSKMAKEKVSVVLSGDGGDESFIGYSKYFALNKILSMANYKREILKAGVNILNENTVEILNSLLPENKRQRNIKDKFQKFKNALNAKDIYEMFFNASSYVDKKLLSNILNHNQIDIKNTGFDVYEKIKNLHPLDIMSVIDYKTFLPDDVLVKVDRASMAVSLEAREPLLDHKIIEYAAKIPVNIKYKNNTGKYLLKQILYKYIPKEMIERPKSGFQVPLIEWLRGDLKELLDSYVNESSLKTSGIYNTKEILKLKQKLYNGENINLSILWFVLMYEMWREKWGG